MSRIRMVGRARKSLKAQEQNQGHFCSNEDDDVRGPIPLGHIFGFLFGLFYMEIMF